MIKSKISICMMVKDEIRHIKECLDSLKPVLESGIAELIIVDTGSTDGTIEVCKTYTKKLYFHEWNNSFSEMRNITISYATGEWILIIDGDEVVENPEEILRVISSDNINEYNTISFKEKNLSDMKGNSYSLITTLRMFKNDNFYYEGSVHNQPICKEPTKNADIMLIHYGYIGDDKSLMEKKFNRTSKLLLKEIERNPNNFYYLYQLGVSYEMNKDIKKAYVYYKKSINVFEKSKIKVEYSYAYIITAYINIAFKVGKYIDAKDYIVKYEKVFVKLPDFNFASANIYQVLCEYNNANKFFVKYLNNINEIKNSVLYSNSAISLYTLDDKSRNTAYSILSKNYLDDIQYEKSYKYAELLDSKDVNKDKLMIANLIYLDNSKLIEYIKNLNEYRFSSLIPYLESVLEECNNEKSIDIINGLSTLNNEYGIICKHMIDNLDNNYRNKEFLILNKFKYNNKNILKILINTDEEFIIKQLSFESADSWNYVIGYLFNNDELLLNRLCEYCLEKKVKLRNIGLNGLITFILEYKILQDIKQEKISDRTNYIYDRYLEYGIAFITNIYGEKLRINYKYISDSRDKFFATIKLAIEEKNINISKEYIKDAIKLNIPLRKFTMKKFNF